MKITNRDRKTYATLTDSQIIEVKKWNRHYNTIVAWEWITPALLTVAVAIVATLAFAGIATLLTL